MISYPHWTRDNPTWCAVIAFGMGVLIVVGLSYLRYAYTYQEPPPSPVMVGSPDVIGLPGGWHVIVAHYDRHYGGPCFREGQYSLSGNVPPGAEIPYYPLGGALNGYAQHSLGSKFSVTFAVAPTVTGTQTFWFRTAFSCPLDLPFGFQLFTPPILVRHFDAVMSVEVVLPP